MKKIGYFTVCISFLFAFVVHAQYQPSQEERIARMTENLSKRISAVTSRAQPAARAAAEAVTRAEVERRKRAGEKAPSFMGYELGMAQSDIDKEIDWGQGKGNIPKESDLPKLVEGRRGPQIGEIPVMPPSGSVEEGRMRSPREEMMSGPSRSADNIYLIGGSNVGVGPGGAVLAAGGRRVPGAVPGEDGMRPDPPSPIVPPTPKLHLDSEKKYPIHSLALVGDGKNIVQMIIVTSALGSGVDIETQRLNWLRYAAAMVEQKTGRKPDVLNERDVKNYAKWNAKTYEVEIYAFRQDNTMQIKVTTKGEEQYDSRTIKPAL
jgi:hypothetical protein